MLYNLHCNTWPTVARSVGYYITQHTTAGITRPMERREFNGRNRDKEGFAGASTSQVQWYKALMSASHAVGLGLVSVLNARQSETSANLGICR